MPTSRIVLFLPGNLFHSNVPAHKRRMLIENFDVLLDILGRSEIPLLLSLQQIDLEILDKTPQDLPKNITLAGTPYNHALLPLTLGWEHLRDHGAWLVEHGPKTDSSFYFAPEFAIPNDWCKPGKLLPVLPDQSSVLYSFCGAGDIHVTSWLDRHSAIQTRGMTLVPMTSIRDVLSTFFTWQRYPDDQGKANALIEAFRNFGTDHPHRYGMIPIDLEAPLVGSHHGLEIWERFFALIRNHGLVNLFVDPSTASEWWQKTATHLDDEDGRFCRRLHKWTGYQEQLDYWNWLAYVMETSEHRHRTHALASTSDVLSAMDTKLSKPFTLEADRGVLTIGYDNTILEVGALVANQDFQANQLPDGVSHPDGKWFAERLCHTVLRKT